MTYRLLLESLLVLSGGLVGCAGPAPSEWPPLFDWMNTLGFPDSRGASLVRVSRLDDPGRVRVAFFLGRGRVIWPGDPYVSAIRLDQWLIEEACNLQDYATVCLEELRQQRSPGFRCELDPEWGLDEPSSASSAVAIAVACHQRGFDSVARELCDEAAYIGAADAGCCRLEVASTAGGLVTRVETEIAHAVASRCAMLFADETYTWQDLLREHEGLAARFPRTLHGEEAKLAAITLREQIASRQVSSAGPEPGSSHESRARELVAQLQEETAPHRWGATGPQASVQLVGLGYRAVPALIDALRDRRFTRCVLPSGGRGRLRVLRVCDYALAILEEIAAQDLTVKENAAAPCDRLARAWWSDVQARGEFAVLSEAVKTGGPGTSRQASRLVRDFQERALPAVRLGARNTKSRSTRAHLLRLAGGLQCEEARRFLWEGLREAPDLLSRLVAAEKLMQSGAEVSQVGLAILEWADNAKLDLGDWTGFELEELVSQAATVGGPGVLGLRLCLPGRPTRLTYGLLSAVARHPEFLTMRLEFGEFLVVLLGDTREFSTLNSIWDGSPVFRPRVCDLAAYALSCLVGDPWELDTNAPLELRERRRREVLKAWRVMVALCGSSAEGDEALENPPGRSEQEPRPPR